MESNLTTNNGTNAGLGELETLGLLFYVASPTKTSYERIEDCPDFVNQVIDRIQSTFRSSSLGHPLHCCSDHP